MADSRFYRNFGPFTLGEVAEWAGAALAASANALLPLKDLAPLNTAQAGDLSFFDNVQYLDAFSSSKASACFVREKFIAKAPAGMAVLISDDPYRAYALAAQRFYPDTLAQPVDGVSSGASIVSDCIIGAGACIGDGVAIGARCSIGSNAVIHSGVIIGDDCHIGANTTLSHCLLGNRIIIHRGAHIGQDGFGFAMSRAGHLKVPQLGRVIIEDDVEIGSATCIDRGTVGDTVVGQGTKIDNMVQIGHNVQIGKQCVIISQCGIAGSTKLGDGVILAGQVGVSGHLTIGSGVRVAAKSGITADLLAGHNYGGIPAQPIKDWHRQVVALKTLTKRKSDKPNTDES